MRLAGRVLSVHPAIVTGLFVAMLICFGADFLPEPKQITSPSTLATGAMLLTTGATVLWLYCLYRAASDRNVAAVGHRGKRGFLFALLAAAMASSMLLFPWEGPVYRPDLGFMLWALAGNLLFFSSVWAAANALTRFESRTRSAAFQSTLGTFALIVYLPLGIWVLYPRIRRMLAAPLSI
ncbi:MAG TPA: hypothetical protein PKY87_02435 [Terricaulis sp.]|nr:hypothetical protein [Terricaulis sp.]